MESRYLIDRKEIFDLLDEDCGYWEYVRMLINEHDLDDHEDAVLRVADDIRETIEDIVESMPVVEERETTICSCFERDYDIAPYYTTKIYLCNNCWEDIEIDADEKELKFCPHCGAKYERIVKDD